MASKKRLGDVLRERGKISAEELTRAVSDQQGKVLKLGELLLARGTLDRADLISALEEVTRVPYHNLREFPPSVEALEYLPRETALRYCAVPYDYDDRSLTVVMAEPQNLRTLDELRFLTGKLISPRLGFRGEILAAIEKHYASAAEEEAEAAALVESKDPSDDTGKDDVGEIEFISVSSRESAREAMAEFQAELTHRRTPAVRLVSRIIARAAARRCSDIHIEPMSSATMVRIRVDGVLRELMQVKGKLQNSLVSRIKVLSDMDIAERRAPQDGRFMVNLAGRKIDFRISTLPTNHGEKVVMRLLEATSALSAFSDMGMDEEVIAALKKILAQPQGMLLVTGPTGSGKSTTLYASLNHLRRPAVNIITVEDPVEYMLDGVNQVQVHTKAGLTFASALRSILRQDPNIIMVGEIRDAETAEIALKASQTGHLVLSTLHTNDSVSAIVRLVDLGIPEYLIASSLSAIVAQRLVRRLCRCKAAMPVSPELRARLVAHGLDDAGATVFAPIGCPECGRTGYRGRVGVYEVLSLDEPLRRAVRAKAASSHAPPEPNGSRRPRSKKSAPGSPRSKKSSASSPLTTTVPTTAGIAARKSLPRFCSARSAPRAASPRPRPANRPRASLQLAASRRSPCVLPRALRPMWRSRWHRPRQVAARPRFRTSLGRAPEMQATASRRMRGNPGSLTSPRFPRKCRTTRWKWFPTATPIPRSR